MGARHLDELLVPAVAPVVDVDVREEEEEAPDNSVLRRGIPLILKSEYHSSRIYFYTI